MTLAENLLESALALPDAERVDLACRILESVSARDKTLLDEWLQELDFRAEAVESKQATTLEWRQALEQIRTSFLAKHSS